MAGKLLRIDVVVDENGSARRALSDLEGGVKKVETAARSATPSVKSIDDTMADWDKRLNELDQSISGTTESVAAQGLAIGELTLGIGSVLVVAGAAGAAIVALGSYVKDATEYYIEQSGVLDINKQAVDSLKLSWDEIKYAIGEVVVGGDGDYRKWVNVVNAGLILIGTNLAADIEFYKELERAGSNAMGILGALTEGATGVSADPGGTPGVDTTVRNPDGSLTPYGRMLQQRAQKPSRPTTWGNQDGDPYSGAQAEAITNAEIAKEKREQLEIERQQKLEAAERLKIANEQIHLENELTAALNKSREQYEAELATASRLNEKKKESLDLQIRDSFMKSTLSAGDDQKYQIGADADRKIASIDPRADNASDLARRYVAERELALIQLRQTQEGFTQGVSDDLNHFRAEFADVVGQLPIQFEQVIPPILDASGAMRDGLSSDLDTVRAQTGMTMTSYQSLGTGVRATYAEIAAGLKAADEAYENAGFIIHPTIETMRLRGQQTGGLLYAAGGLVEPMYRASGGPAGTDTVPAYLTPGEGVLSRGGMSALDRLNGGGTLGAGRAMHVTIEKGAIDARGAQFADEASLDSLVDKIAMRVTAIAERTGASA